VVGEGDPVPGTSASNALIVAVPAWVRIRIPAKPEEKLASATLAIQPAGSVPEAIQTFAVRVEPTARKWMVYFVPAVAVNGTLAKLVSAPATFFWMTRLWPLMYALYQSLPSVHRSTSPKLLLTNDDNEPVANTSVSVAAGPSTAL
jgi:hypothetical protein